MRLRFSRFPASVATIALAAAAGLTLLPSAASAQLVPISGLSPNPDGGDPSDPLAVTACNGAPQPGVVYRNSETEPHLAVNPTDPDNMIAAWHQDRWSTGAAQSVGAAYTFDGGVTWTQVAIPFTRCSSGAGTAGGDFERASDAWISFSPDGTAHYMAIVYDASTGADAMAIAHSEDGGVTWTAPAIIKQVPAHSPVQRTPLQDKNTVTADPYDPDLAYATWTVFRWGSNALVFARSTDGGASWSATRPINTLDKVSPANLANYHQGGQIEVLPDGTLVNFFYRVLSDKRTDTEIAEQALFRSDDQGKHWEHVDTVISPFEESYAIDPELDIPVRDAGPLPDTAVNRDTGDLYVVWQDRISPDELAVYISASADGGTTWSNPVRANPETPDGVQAFLPEVAVNDQGVVGVMFYDFRNDVLGDDPLGTDVYLSLFAPDLTFLDERRLTPEPMDLRQSVITGARGYFPGDYMGLDTAGGDFVAAFTLTNDLGLPVDFPQDNDGVFVDNHNRTDIVFARVTP